jgi:hypothetical protein
MFDGIDTSARVTRAHMREREEASVALSTIAADCA